MNRTLQRDNRRSWEAQVMGFGLYKGIAMLGMTAITATVPTQAQTCEPHWSEQYASPYIDGWPTAITIFDDGSGSGPRPYIGGMHLVGPGITLNDIAQLNENNGWSPLADGFDDFVFALTTFDDGSGDSDALYTVGSFTIAGKISANKVAKWDGQMWSALGEGLDGSGYSVAVFDDGTGAALYVGGIFENAGGISANNIAKWDGQNWSPLDIGIEEDVVYALTVFDDGSGPALYAGGYFQSAGGVSAQNIAKWDGVNWSPLGEGTDSIIRSLVVFDDGSGSALYAAGDFLEAGGDYARRIARWDGISWSQLGTGISNRVLDLTVVDFVNGPALFAAGYFFEAGGVACSRIAKWDGKSWSPLGAGLNMIGGPITFALSPFDDGSDNGPVLLVAGRFDYAGDIPAENFARWDGKEWSTAGGIFPTKFSGRAMTVVEEGGNVDPGLYCGGFSDFFGVPVVNNITHLKDGEWVPVGPGTSGSVQTLKHFDDGSGPALFVGGGFFEAGGMPANRVAKWDGNSWSPLGDGVDDTVMTMCVFDDGAGDGPLLYAGGAFKHSGDTSMYCIAKWDGKNWNALGQNINQYSQSVRTMIVFDDGTGYGDALYVGGDFFIGLNTGEFINIARWDGSQWSQVGAGSNSIVYAFAIYDDGSGPALYASGQFPNTDGIYVYGLGRWDGEDWSIVPGGEISNGSDFITIFTLQVFNDGLSDRPALYVGGRFNMIGSTAANQIARWHGKTWSALGSGLESIPQVDPYAFSMAVFDDGGPQGESLYVTGSFLLADGNSSNNYAQWIPCINPILGDLNGDGSVNTADLLILFANWGPCAECSADLDNDGFVGTSDLLIHFSKWK